MPLQLSRGKSAGLKNQMSSVQLGPGAPGADEKQIEAATWGTPGAVLTNLNVWREPQETLFLAYTGRWQSLVNCGGL